MTNFSRALKEAWRHWRALAAAMLCSIGVATLWGANIAALFPIIETTLNGKSLGEWNHQRLEKSTASLEAKQVEAQTLDTQIAAAVGDQQRGELELQRDMLEARMRVDRAGVYSAQRLQPFFDKYLPSSPFATVVMIVCMIVVATALKQACSLANILLVAYVSQHRPRSARPDFQQGPGARSPRVQRAGHQRLHGPHHAHDRHAGHRHHQLLRRRRHRAAADLRLPVRRLVHLLAADAGVADFRPVAAFLILLPQPPNPRTVHCESSTARWAFTM